jgi:hypothetical protein
MRTTQVVTSAVSRQDHLHLRPIRVGHASKPLVLHAAAQEFDTILSIHADREASLLEAANPLAAGELRPF